MTPKEELHTSEPVDGLPAVTPSERERLLTDLLRSVSRAFYLTLRVLPRGLREPMGLAYLLARAADTIADTRLLPPGERLRHLMVFKAQVEGPATMQALRQIESSLTDMQESPDERTLLISQPEMFALLEALPEAERARVRSVVVTLTHGMEIDLTTFPAEDSGELAAFKSFDELDDYIYYVAGCVGEFWTEFIVANTPSLAGWDIGRMSEISVRFGKALQLTNILRDVPKDLRNGRCYLPEEELARVGLTPEALLDPSTSARARPMLVRGIRDALDHYRAAEEYILAIPRRCLRLRLAVLWPVLIGMATLIKLACNEAWLDPEQPSKVSRNWVYGMMALSFLLVPSNRALKFWMAQLREQVEQSLVVE
ncbi:MAG: squalene/phytoene synthase family protein [Chloroflexi bacterium]|nr:squalene/phytoene synthase family protein [Chloroflexota bacterium]